MDRGIPLAAIRWLRMTNVPQPLEITSNYDPRFRIVENGLEISNVQLSDEGTYRCYVYNEHGTEILHIDAVFKGKAYKFGTSDEAKYCCYVYNSISVIIFDIQALYQGRKVYSVHTAFN